MIKPALNINNDFLIEDKYSCNYPSNSLCLTFR
jgi:hypothetical protein